MSYTIEYRRLFLKSSEGYTPCWLAGESNVWEGYGRSQRRARSWSCFHNLVGVSREEIMRDAQSSLGSDEHWMKNGKWVNDKGLIAWVENGCKKAVTVEEFLKENPNMSDIHCYVSVWQNLMNHRELEFYVSSSYELDRWIREYRVLRQLLINDRCSIYPVIDLGPETVKFPNKTSTTQGDVLLKRKNQYVCDADESSVSWTSDAHKAKVFSWEEAGKLTRVNHFLRNVRAINADIKIQPFNAVIRFSDGIYAGRYIFERCKNRLRVCCSVENALRYPNEREAQKVVKALAEKYSGKGTLSVETIN